MPSGTAPTKDGDAGLDRWDAVEAAIKKSLRQGFLDRPAAAPPESDSPPDADLLRYVDGTLSPQEHAAMEQRLLGEPAARRQVAVLAEALSESRACQPPSPQGPRPARYVFQFYQGKLQFLRCTRELASDETFTASSSSSPLHFTHQADPLTARFSLTPSADHIRLHLCLRERDRPAPGRVALLRQGGPGDERPTEIETDGDGGVTFSGLRAGRYEVRLPEAAGSAPIILDIRA